MLILIRLVFIHGLAIGVNKKFGPFPSAIMTIRDSVHIE